MGEDLYALAAKAMQNANKAKRAHEEQLLQEQYGAAKKRLTDTSQYTA